VRREVPHRFGDHVDAEAVLEGQPDHCGDEDETDGVTETAGPGVAP